MDEPRAQRTLVKSPPELWAEISDLDALARHLGEFGEIRITRLEPETAVAWEGDRVRGTVQLEPSGWGTKVTLTAQLEDGGGEAPDEAREDPPQAGASPPPEWLEEQAPARSPAVEAEVEGHRRGIFARWLARWRRRPEPAAVEEPAAVAEPAAPTLAEPPAFEEPPAVVEPPAAPTVDRARAEAVLVEVLDDLGAARHRPFSRAS